LRLQRSLEIINPGPERRRTTVMTQSVGEVRP